MKQKIKKYLETKFGPSKKRSWYISDVCWHSYWQFSLKRVRWTASYSDYICLYMFNFGIFFRLPPLHPEGLVDKRGDKRDEYMYGVYLYNDKELNYLDLVWGWGTYSGRFYFPWFTWEWKSTEILDKNRNVLLKETLKDRKQDFGIRFKIERAIKDAFKEEFDFTYKLKNGQIQERKAKVNVERRTWHRKWFPWVEKIHTTIAVEFSDEVGEKTGSWKGGVVGSAYQMLPNETPEQCLRRMEKEREF